MFNTETICPMVLEPRSTNMVPIEHCRTLYESRYGFRTSFFFGGGGTTVSYGGLHYKLHKSSLFGEMHKVDAKSMLCSFFFLLLLIPL